MQFGLPERVYGARLFDSEGRELGVWTPCYGAVAIEKGPIAVRESALSARIENSEGLTHPMPTV